jgi:hypothetical protein
MIWAEVAVAVDVALMILGAGIMTVIVTAEWMPAGIPQAERKGLALLRPWLSPEQVEQFSSYKYFEVIGSHTGKRYRIRRGTSMNIDELDSAGNKVCAWCLLPEETWLPVTSCSHRKSRWRLSRATLWLSQTESADRGLPDCGHRFVP